MSTFVYKVRDSRGMLVSGALEGDTVMTVVTKLRQMGYVVLDVSEQGLARRELNLPFLGKVKPKDLTVFSRQFATMINAGVSLTRCLAILAQQTENRKFREVIRLVLQDVEKGRSLSDAMSKQPVFPNLFVNMVRAGETGGVLDEVLLRVADHFESEAAIRRKIKSATTYPAAMFSFAMLVAFVLVTFIVPIFAKMLSDWGGELPLPTKVLVVASDGIRAYWYMVLPIIVGLGYVTRLYMRTQRGRTQVDRIKLRLPVFGKLIRKMCLSRFSRTLGTLITSGVPILQALDIVGDTSGNSVIAESVKRTRSSVKDGDTIARPLSEDRNFPPMVVQMIAVGEETGALDTMLSKVADFYDAEVSSMVDTLMSLIEPLLIVFMGGIIGGIVISLYLPIFKMATLVK